MLNFQDLVQQTRPLLAGDVLATVVDNADPRQLGRIRVAIPGVMTDQLTVVSAGARVGKYTRVAKQPAAAGQTGLPWIAPARPAGVASLDVPEVGTVVSVRFRNNNPAEGQYTATATTQQAMPAELLQDYPHSYGWKNNRADWFRINKQTGIWDIHHHSGFHVTVDDAGDVTVTYPGNLTETVQGNVTRTVQGTIVETCQTKTVTVQGDLTTSVSGTLSNQAGTEISNTAPVINNQGPA
jgi:hypothetical protein